jgi:hypothetical protein
MKYTFYLLFIITFLISGFTLTDEIKPHVKVVRKKLADCDGKGSSFNQLFVGSKVKDEKIEVWLFVQKYDLHWLKKVYRLEKSGVIESGLSSCDFTGNYLAVAFYNSDNDAHDINLKEVPIIHNSRGDKPKFKVTRRSKLSEDHGGGVYFEEGEIFTPKGEEVEITLFLERKNGQWRKKHYNFIGSGNISLDVSGDDLTGRYKSHVNIVKDFTAS